MDWSNLLIYGGIVTVLLAVVTVVFKAGTWKGGMDDFRKMVGESIKTIQEDIKKILERLPRPEVAGESPLRLTDFGRTLSTDIGGHAWAQDRATKVVDNVRGKQPYEVQEYCFEYVGNESNYTDDFLQKMRSCAYNNGTDLKAVKRVLGVELRDALLKLLGSS